MCIIFKLHSEGSPPAIILFSVNGAGLARIGNEVWGLTCPTVRDRVVQMGIDETT
jgi:hypothetical protein